MVSAWPYIQGSAWEGFQPVSQAQLWDSAVTHTPLASYCFQTQERSTAVQFSSQPDPFLATPSGLMETAAELLSPGQAPGGSAQGTAIYLLTLHCSSLYRRGPPALHHLLQVLKGSSSMQQQ